MYICTCIKLRAITCDGAHVNLVCQVYIHLCVCVRGKKNILTYNVYLYVRVHIPNSVYM